VFTEGVSDVVVQTCSGRNGQQQAHKHHGPVVFQKARLSGGFESGSVKHDGPLSCLFFELFAGLIKLKDHGVVFLLMHPLVTGPAHAHGAHELRELHGERLSADLIGDELGSAHEVHETVAEEERLRTGGLLRGKAFGQAGELAADKLRCVKAEPHDDAGIEAFHAHIALVAAQ